MSKAIMVQGTMSNVGKSVLTAALCRIMKQDGHTVAPFKAQNMALNSFITRDGLEMGRAQVMQAEAAGILPDIRMNPILLKPTSDQGSQVIVNGKSIGNYAAAAYYEKKAALRPLVQQAYQSLAADYDIIVLEGAGSPAEINLKQDDLVNMGMARMARAPVLLVGDIDRGGVFAQLYGTTALLEKEERAYVKGLIINKFRGDVSILRPGLSMLEERVRKSVLGVIPYTQWDLDDEDSLSERLTSRHTALAAITIAVVRLPRLSNFTDFNALSRMPGVEVLYAEHYENLANADCIILPGSKNTIADLKWMRQNGMEAAIRQKAAAGTPVIGICGGYQMMGQRISDPESAEDGGAIRGMELLPVDTIFSPQKQTTQAQGRFASVSGVFASLSKCPFAGYEIHMGRSTLMADGKPLTMLTQETSVREDGCQHGNCYGTYVHGIFDQSEICTALIQALCALKGIPMEEISSLDMEQYKQQQYDHLADSVRQALDMEAIYRILEAGI